MDSYESLAVDKTVNPVLFIGKLEFLTVNPILFPGTQVRKKKALESSKKKRNKLHINN